MYQTIFWHAGVLTIIFAVGDVLLFVILKIPKVIGQLTGRTARKGIADIWKKNIQTRGRCYKSCAENQNFGSIAGGMTESGNMKQTYHILKILKMQFYLIMSMY